MTYWYLCEYCSDHIHHDEDMRVMPDHLPDDLPWGASWDVMRYHRDCFDNAVYEYRQEIATKHGGEHA